MIYDRNWMVAFLPALLWLAEQGQYWNMLSRNTFELCVYLLSGCGWYVVYIEATLHTAATLNEKRIVPFITTVLSLTLAMTTMTTGARLPEYQPPSEFAG